MAADNYAGYNSGFQWQSGGQLPKSHKGRWENAMTEQGQRGTRAQNWYEQQAYGYDPREALGGVYQGILGDMQQQMGDQLRDMGQMSAAQGRGKSGYFTDEQNKSVERFRRGAMNDFLRAGTTLEGMWMNHMNNVGAYGMANTGRFNDLMAADREYGLMNRQIDAQNRGSILGAIGTVGGALLAGPAGSAIGGWLGGKLGR